MARLAVGAMGAAITLAIGLFPSSVSAVGGQGSLWLAWTGQAAPDRPTILIALLATTTLVTLAAAASFRWSERRARDRGLIDMTTGS